MLTSYESLSRVSLKWWDGNLCSVRVSNYHDRPFIVQGFHLIQILAPLFFWCYNLPMPKAKRWLSVRLFLFTSLSYCEANLIAMLPFLFPVCLRKKIAKFTLQNLSYFRNDHPHFRQAFQWHIHRLVSFCYNLK